LLIVEPSILIPTTQIVKAFPCARKAYLQHQFKSLNGDINYALVLGNVIHAIFQQILYRMDFRKEILNEIVKESIKSEILLFYSLNK
jgi:CRISPR/Cas system-associated exonuclease Cas4 (RecB family)